LTPQKICDKYFAIHKQVYEWFNLKFDYFGRTSTEKQTKIAQEIFTKLYQNGFTQEQVLKQLFCEKDKMFLADRFVHGICPICQYEDARGDQCDKCGNLLSPEQLVEPRCSICSNKPIEKSTEHLFLDLPKLAQQIEEWKIQSVKTGCWSSVAVSITDAWLKDGLKPRCITRDLKWGTPVPLEKYKDKVFYVWFDAPIGYISITANYTDDWEQWWKNPELVENVEFMGKDNVPFHSVVFPGSLLGTQEKWSLVNKLSATEWLNYEDGKFSKSRGTGVFGDTVQELGIPSDIFRYYLISIRPESADSICSWDDLLKKNNSELLNNLGNFVNRALKFCEANFSSVVPELVLNQEDKDLIAQVNESLTEYNKQMEGLKIRDGLFTCMKISSLGNLYLQNQKPWDVLKTDAKRCGSVITLSINLSYLLAAILEPYIPEFSLTLFTQIGKPHVNSKIPDAFDIFSVVEGHKIGVPLPILKKLDPKDIAKHKERFAGKKDNFSLELKVGQILEVEAVKESDKLYALKVDVGEKTLRNIGAGLRSVYSAEELLNRKVVVVCNLVHAKLGPITSEGMLLAASDKEKTVLLVPPKDSPCGKLVLPEGYKSAPEPGLKKNALLKLLPHFKIQKEGIASYKSNPLCVGDLHVVAPGVTEGAEIK
jgi:methionyl-tRNA synthetase